MRRGTAGVSPACSASQAETLDVRPRGYLLVEMIVYCLIVLAIVGVLSSTVFFSVQSLRKRAERELNDERWLMLVEALRDDLRSAQRIHWRPPTQPGQRDRLLEIQRPDGAKIEFLRTQRDVVRRVTDARGDATEMPFAFQTSSWKLSVPAEETRGFWDLREADAGTLLATKSRPLFIYMTVTVHGEDQRFITEQFGVSMRCETVQEKQR